MASPFRFDACPTCCEPSSPPCNNCTGITPTSWQVQISGVANSDCTGCSALNGTFILTSGTSPCASLASNPCFAYYRFGYRVICTDGAYEELHLWLNASGIRVEVYSGFRDVNDCVYGGGVRHRWSASVTSPWNCAGASALSLSPVYSVVMCNISGSTCLVTAL